MNFYRDCFYDTWLTGSLSGALGVKYGAGVVGVEQRLQEGDRHGSSQGGQTLTKRWQLSEGTRRQRSGVHALDEITVRKTRTPLHVDVLAGAQRVEAGQDSVAGHLNVLDWKKKDIDVRNKATTNKNLCFQLIYQLFYY